MKRGLGAAIAACTLAVPTLAFSAGNYVDGFYVPSSNIDFGPGDDDGDGLGLKGAFQVADRVFLSAEYASIEYDDSNADLDEIRLGALFGTGASAVGGGLYGGVQYVDYDFDPGSSLDGFGAMLGYALPVSGQFRLHGEIGYLFLDDADGPELLIGGTYAITPNLGVFADYRTSYLDPDGGGDLDISDLRIGARFSF